jgi:hypothetical protein
MLLSSKGIDGSLYNNKIQMQANRCKRACNIDFILGFFGESMI